MGLSFHYSGSLITPELLPELVAEVRDIAEVLEWPYCIYNQDLKGTNFGSNIFNDNIYGISFTPPECEPVFISFLSNGKMSSPMLLQSLGRTPNHVESKYLYIISVKTQFAGIEIHKAVVQLFRYLNLKYFAFFKMIDEGNFWETSDEKVLETNFQRYSELFKNFSSDLGKHPLKASESVETYMVRLLKIIREKKKGGNLSGQGLPEQ
jgi:hypothetical protein